MKSAIHLRSAIAFAIAATLLPLLFAACDESTTVVTANAERLILDQQFYPTEEGTFWRYRMDSIGTSGQPFRDYARRTVRILGRVRIDTLDYTLQISETVSGANATYDTVYIRKTAEGVWLSSPQLRLFSIFSGLPGFPGLPKEFLVIPAKLEALSNWDIIRFDYSPIPLLQIKFHVTASYLGRQTIQTDEKTFRDCALIRLSIDAQFPDPQDPTNIFNPITIRESADFFLSRPLGLVVGDGSEAAFALLSGRIPFSFVRRRIHQEVIGMDIVQPKDFCIGIAK